MNTLRLCAVLAAAAAAVAVAGCGKEDASSGAGTKTGGTAARKVVEEKVPPYSYPAPVKGHVKETNIGEFDLVDGIAYPAAGGGTVVHVFSKPIASPLLVESSCPLTQARALSKLRNAGFAEVTLDDKGRSKYFAAASPFAGGLTDFTPRAWTSTLRLDGARATGNVVHRQYGHFEFDLPMASPTFDQISDGDHDAKRKLDPTTPKPTEQAITAAYIALRDAAHRRDLKATLAAMGFDAKQSLAIRGMEGIDADFAVFTGRFLDPGTPGDPWKKPGAGQIRGEGLKADGRKFADDYYFDSCGDHLVLVYIVEQAFAKQ